MSVPGSSSPAVSPRLPRVVWIPIALLAALFAAQSLVHVGDEATQKVLRDWTPLVLYAAAATGCLVRARLVAADRLAWTLLGAGIASYLLGSFIWVLGDADRPVEDVSPAITGLWLVFYACAYVAAGLLLRARVRPFHVTFWLDGLIGAAALAALTAAVYVPHVEIQPELGTVQILSGLSYTAADLLLLAICLWAIVITGWRRNRMWLLLAGAFALLCAGDTALSLSIAAGEDTRGSLIHVAFPTAMLLIALAAFQPVTRVRALRMDSPLALAVPVGWVVACLGLLLFDDALELSRAGQVLALAALFVALVRAIITLLEVGSLYESRRFERGFQDAAIGMALVSLDLRCQRVNDSLSRLLRRDAATLAGTSLRDLAHPEDRDRLDALTTGGAPVEARLLRADGAVADVVLSAALVGEDERDPYLFCQLEDVTARRRAERLSAAAAELGRRAIRTQDVRALMDDIVSVTTAELRTGGCFVAHSDGRSATMLASAEPSVRGGTYPLSGRSMIEALLRDGVTIRSNDLRTDERFDVHPMVAERRLTRTVGTPIPRQADDSYVVVVHRRDDEPPFSAEDVSFLESVANVLATALDRAETEAATRHQALHDPLTGLANRAFLQGQIERALAGARRDRSSVALLLLDVDRFKLVNDTIGHSAGDAILCQVAERLRDIVRGGDIAARLGGDEFVVACSGVEDERDVAGLAARIVEAFAAPFAAGGREWQLGASVGVALGGAGATADELLRDADLAMYRAKDGGGDRYEIFDAAMRARVVQRLGLEAALHAAVDRGELVLHYQPLVDLATGGLEGFEALLRWEHPERGLVGPDEFIAIAEDTDLILPIGHWVLRTACSQIAAWNAAHPERPPVHVRVNVSPRQITPALPAAVATAVRQTGIDASQLGLEITERLLVEEPTASSILEEVRELGVSVALDDFGTGYSSLSYLKSYPVDVLKLDRSLIAELGRSPEATAIVKAAVDMAAALGLRAVGEGIEDAAQALELRRLGCPLGQGFLFSRPLPLGEADALVASAAPFFAAA